MKVANNSEKDTKTSLMKKSKSNHGVMKKSKEKNIKLKKKKVFQMEKILNHASNMEKEIPKDALIQMEQEEEEEEDKVGENQQVYVERSTQERVNQNYYEKEDIDETNEEEQGVEVLGDVNKTKRLRDRRSKDMVFDLDEINWNGMNLPSIQKCFYISSKKFSAKSLPQSNSHADVIAPHKEIIDMNQRKAQQFRNENEIKVIQIDVNENSNEERNSRKIEGDDIPKPFLEFHHATPFPEWMQAKLLEAKFEKPTPIQSQTWPIILQGSDLIGIAETGSGKTLAFVLPGLVHLTTQIEIQKKFYGKKLNKELGETAQNHKIMGPFVLILTPTRELAQQIHSECQKFAPQFHTVCILGGDNRKKQIRQVKKGGEIFIATPGRLLDFIDAKLVSLLHVTYVVLDEADRMLDMGFSPQISQILSQIRPERQTLMFSATWGKSVQKLAQQFLMSSEVFLVKIGKDETSANKNVKQQFLFIQENDKMTRILKLFDEIITDESCKTLIFCQTKRTVDFVTEKLRVEGWPALGLHGDRSQKEREWVVSSFVADENPFLVATDVAARGLDFKDIKYVINYDMPVDIETYVHRIGRTGRAGNQGCAISLFTPENITLTQSLHRVLSEAKQEIPEALEKLNQTLMKKKK